MCGRAKDFESLQILKKKKFANIEKMQNPILSK